MLVKMWISNLQIWGEWNIYNDDDDSNENENTGVDKNEKVGNEM